MKNSEKRCIIVTIVDFGKIYGRFKVSITFDPETSQHLTKLAEITKESVQELAKRLVVEGIECEVEDIALYKTIKECEDVDWSTVLSERART